MPHIEGMTRVKGLQRGAHPNQSHRKKREKEELAGVVRRMIFTVSKETSHERRQARRWR